MNNENEVMNRQSPVEIRPPENMFLGFLGALAGAVIGGASIVLLSQLGYIASISGVLLAVCTLRGYELLAGGISRAGAVFCGILMIFTPFLADWIDWAIFLMEYELSFGEAFLMFPRLLTEGAVVLGEYLKNLGMIYLFVIMGGFYTVKDALKRNK